MTDISRTKMFEKDCNMLRDTCIELTFDMEAYMSNELDDDAIKDLKVKALDALFEIQNMISEIDSTYGLMESDKSQSNEEHGRLVEYLLGTLEDLEMIFNKQ